MRAQRRGAAGRRAAKGRKFQDSSFKIRVSRFKIRVSRFKIRYSRIKFQDSIFNMQVSRFQLSNIDGFDETDENQIYSHEIDVLMSFNSFVDGFEGYLHFRYYLANVAQ